MPEDQGGNGIRWRLENLERRVADLERVVNTVARMEERLTYLNEDVKGLRRAFYTFAFGSVLAAVTIVGSVMVLLVR